MIVSQVSRGTDLYVFTTISVYAIGLDSRLAGMVPLCMHVFMAKLRNH
jgi:hypothetical protein